VSQKITTEQRGHLFLIGLNRPEKMNAADEQLLHELSLAYGELDRNKELRVGVVFAHGEHFTAGTKDAKGKASNGSSGRTRSMGHLHKAGE
jgi:enoyl-CoA hydratase/carnithine racemase